MLRRKGDQGLRRRPVEDGLGERGERVAVEVTKMPVAGNAALGKGDELDAAAGGLGNEAADLLEVRLLVRGRVLELDRRNTDVLHGAKVRRMPVVNRTSFFFVPGSGLLR